MDLFFADPSEVPLPPNEVRIREVRTEPYPDGRRVRVVLELDPFQKRPSAELNMLDEQGQVVAAVHIVETMTRQLSLTMHVRGAAPGEYRLQVELFYAGDLDMKPAEADAPPSLPPERQVVHSVVHRFSLPAAQET